MEENKCKIYNNNLINNLVNSNFKGHERDKEFLIGNKSLMDNSVECEIPLTLSDSELDEVTTILPSNVNSRLNTLEIYKNEIDLLTIEKNKLTLELSKINNFINDYKKLYDYKYEEYLFILNNLDGETDKKE